LKHTKSFTIDRRSRLITVKGCSKQKLCTGANKETITALVPGKLIFISFNSPLPLQQQQHLMVIPVSECYSFKMSTYTDGAPCKVMYKLCVFQRMQLECFEL